MIVMSSSKEKYKCTIPIPQDKSKVSMCRISSIANPNCIALWDVSWDNSKPNNCEDTLAVGTMLLTKNRIVLVSFDRRIRMIKTKIANFV